MGNFLVVSTKFLSFQIGHPVLGAGGVGPGRVLQAAGAAKKRKIYRHHHRLIILSAGCAAADSQERNLELYICLAEEEKIERS